jgi:chemotaxis signal transduction protein
MTENPLDLVHHIEAKELELYALRSRLARFRADARWPDGPISVVRCTIGGRAVGFCAVDIDEVVAMASLIRLPQAPCWIAGLLQIGAERVVAIDLAAQESSTPRLLDPRQFLVIARARGRRVALVVDALHGLITLTAADIHRPTSEVSFAPHVLGVASAEGQPLLLLAVEPLGALTASEVAE